MLVYVKLEQIEDNPFQARREHGDIEELAGRIAAARASYPDTYGLMQVPRGRAVFRNAAEPDGRVLSLEQIPATSKYLNYDSAIRVQLAFGHRRLRAFRHLHETGAAGYVDGLFPVHLDALSDEQMLDSVWAENRERKDISAVEEAELMAVKLQRVSSQRELAEAWGLARPTVSNRLRLLELPAEVQQANRQGLLSERTAQRLLKVVELNTAVNGADWHALAVNQWQREKAPAEFLAAVLKQPEQYTSDDVDRYVQSALKYVSRELPQAIATFDCEHPDARQSQCKGCPARVNQSCLDQACLDVKKFAYRNAIVIQIADEFGVGVSDDAKDFTTAAHERDARRAIKAAWERRAELPDVSFVIGWRDGYGLRPFCENSDWLASFEEFKGDGRAGIVIGVRGGSLPENAAAVVAEAAEPAEDIASSTLQEAWGKRGAAIIRRAEKAALAALAETVAYEVSNTDVLQALIMPADRAWIDDADTFARELVKFCWHRGSGVGYASQYLGMVQRIRATLTRAGLQPDAVLSSGVKAHDLADAAVLALDYWYNKRCWATLTAVAEFREYAQPLLAAWPAAGGEELDQLQTELQRALRDAAGKEAELNKESEA